MRISKGLISDSVRFTNFIFPGITRNGTDSSLYYQSIGVGPLIIWTLLHSLIALAFLQWNPVNATTVKNPGRNNEVVALTGSSK